MASSWTSRLSRRQNSTAGDSGNWNWRATASPEGLVLESWSEGFMVGSLIIMGCVTVANMRRHVPLHKLILAELLLAMSHGTFCFMTFSGYGWYLSSTALLLYTSWIIHNIVAWMKVRPFFTQPGGFFKPMIGLWTERIYLGSLALTVPVIAVQISNNFRYFNNRGGYYREFRPYEPLFRDPWWIFTCVVLFHVVRKCYGSSVFDLIRKSPRFGILLLAILLSVVFTICDIVAAASHVVGSKAAGTDGINPWWKLSLVFKALTDTILLDDFKTELKRLGVQRITREERMRNGVALVADHDPENYLAPEDNVYEHGPIDGATQPKKRNKWYGGRSPKPYNDAESSPLQVTRMATTGLSPNSNAKTTQSMMNRTPPIGDIDFQTALALGPSLSSPEPQHIEFANKRGSDQERHHINNDKSRISHLPKLHIPRFEAIRSVGKKPNSQDSNSISSDSSNHDDSRKEPAIPSINPLQNVHANAQPADDTTLTPSQQQTQTLMQSHDRELEEAKRRSERISRERRFRQSIGADERF